MNNELSICDSSMYTMDDRLLQPYMIDASAVLPNNITFVIGDNKVTLENNDDDELCVVYEGTITEAAKTFLETVEILAKQYGYVFGKVKDGVL